MAETVTVAGIVYTKVPGRWRWYNDRHMHAYLHGSAYTQAGAGKGTDILNALASVTDERDALLEDAVRMRAAGDALYESMDCQECRRFMNITFCAQCEADREQWCNLAPITVRAEEGSP